MLPRASEFLNVFYRVEIFYTGLWVLKATTIGAILWEIQRKTVGAKEIRPDNYLIF